MAALPEVSEDIHATTSTSKKGENKIPPDSSDNDSLPPPRADGWNQRAFTRESDIRFPNSLVVNNDRVRYYYNKTLCLRVAIGEMLGQLEKLHSHTFAYLSQFPETGDYSIIGTIFELIATLSTMIDWTTLNQPCYWDDFCRETKQLEQLLDRVNGAAMKCSDTATDVLTKANEIFEGLIEPSKQRVLKIEKALSYRKLSDYLKDNPRSQSIQIDWRKPGDSIELQWHDADGGLINVLLNNTGSGFRLRFLRHIIYHARTCLERAYTTFSKLNIALRLHIPVDKLAKCQDVELKQLAPQELACLTKAKREFDMNLDTIWNLISRFKFQTFHLFKYNDTFRGLRRSRDYAPKTIPTFMKVTMCVDDSLLMRVISCGIEAEAKEESFDFTVFPDRTEDIIAKIEDLLTVDNKSYDELHRTLVLAKIIFPEEKGSLTFKELANVREDIDVIFAHRQRIRQWLKKSIELFEKHAAFQKMDQLKLLPSLKDISKEGQKKHFVEDMLGTGSDEDDQSYIPTCNNNNNPEIDPEKWITLDGNIKIVNGESQGVLAMFPYSNGPFPYAYLTCDEKVIINIRLFQYLLSLMANEQCWAKVSHERIIETKSLVKRLKLKERQDPGLQNAVLEKHRNLTGMLKLTKAIRFLRE